MAYEWLEHFLPIVFISAIVGFAGGFAIMMGGGILAKFHYNDLPYSVSVIVKGACVFGLYMAVAFTVFSGALAFLPLLPLPDMAQSLVVRTLAEIGEASYSCAAIYGLTLGAILILLAFILNFGRHD